MILPKHPDLMSDDELREWVLELVARETPESIFLDYKQTVATKSRSDKREIAKDVSSFANERGGVVLYGVSQKERDSGEPIPAEPIGMASIPGLPQIIEDILVDALTPSLPELRVREITLEEPPDKVVYLVWHPESWEAPHMIHAYGQHRYYRRGNFRAVVMEEGEVERLYLRRQSRRTLAAQFLQDADFGESLFSPDQLPMRIVVCPAFLFENRCDFSQRAMREWLRENDPLHRGQGWYPFIDGVRFFGVRSRYPEEEGPDRRYRSEVRLFRNDAVSRYDEKRLTKQGTVLSGLTFLWRLHETLSFVGEFYEWIGMIGDVLIDIAGFNMKGVSFDVGLEKLGFLYEPVQDDQLVWRNETLQFRVMASVTELLTRESRWALERCIMDRLTQCFGIWTIPSYFRENGSPAFRGF